MEKTDIGEGVTEVGAISGLISGSVALYLGLQDGFHPDYDYLNTISTLYGAGAISAGISHFGGKAYRSFKELRKVLRYFEENKFEEYSTNTQRQEQQAK